MSTIARISQRPHPQTGRRNMDSGAQRVVLRPPPSLMPGRKPAPQIRQWRRPLANRSKTALIPIVVPPPPKSTHPVVRDHPPAPPQTDPYRCVEVGVRREGDSDRKSEVPSNDNRGTALEGRDRRGDVGGEVTISVSYHAGRSQSPIPATRGTYICRQTITTAITAAATSKQTTHVCKETDVRVSM